MTRPARRAAAAALALLLGASLAPASEFRTRNFTVQARTPDLARRVGEAAEVYRKELALEWTGQVMPNWTRPCPIKVTDGDIGAGGSTTFTFDKGQVFGWRMNVQGTVERILDSVLPHEVSHTIFASYFRRPLPRWADEGAATLVEHESEKARQTKLLNQVIKTRKRIPLSRLLAMTEYPERMQDVLTLYAEGYALADLLVQKRGKATYLKVLDTAHRSGWETALRKHYGYDSVAALEKEWTGWVMAGSPTIPSDTLVASVTPVGARGQSPGHSGSATRGQNRSLPGSSLRTAAVRPAPGRGDRSRLTRPVLVRAASNRRD